MRLNYGNEGNSRKFGIYEIFNGLKNRSYIGQTSRFFNMRWAEHKKSLLDTISKARGRTNILLKNDFQKCLNEQGNDNDSGGDDDNNGDEVNKNQD